MIRGVVMSSKGTLILTRTAKNLRVTFDDHLNVTDHISTTAWQLWGNLVQHQANQTLYR